MTKKEKEEGEIANNNTVKHTHDQYSNKWIYYDTLCSVQSSILKEKKSVTRQIINSHNCCNDVDMENALMVLIHFLGWGCYHRRCCCY